MTPAMLEYENFEIDSENADFYSLPDAIAKARAIRSSHPDTFARVESIDNDRCTVKALPASEVYAAWMQKIQNRLGRVLSKRMAR